LFVGEKQPKNECNKQPLVCAEVAVCSNLKKTISHEREIAFWLFVGKKQPKNEHNNQPLVCA